MNRNHYGQTLFLALCLIGLTFFLPKQTAAQEFNIPIDTLDQFMFDGKYREGLDYTLKLMKRIEADSGSNSVLFARIQASYLGTFYENLFNFGKAAESYRSAFSLLKEKLGVGHLFTAEAQANLGALFVVLNQAEKGIAELLEARPVLERFAGRHSESFSACSYMLGNGYQLMGEYAKALNYFSEAEQFLKGIAKPDYRHLRYYLSVSALDLNMGYYASAIEKLKRAMALLVNKEKSIEYYNISYNLFLAYYLNLQKQESDSIFEKLINDSVFKAKFRLLYETFTLCKAALQSREGQYQSAMHTMQFLGFKTDTIIDYRNLSVRNFQFLFLYCEYLNSKSRFREAADIYDSLGVYGKLYLEGNFGVRLNYYGGIFVNLLLQSKYEQAVNAYRILREIVERDMAVSAFTDEQGLYKRFFSLGISELFLHSLSVHLKNFPDSLRVELYNWHLKMTSRFLTVNLIPLRNFLHHSDSNVVRLAKQVFGNRELLGKSKIAKSNSFFADSIRMKNEEMLREVYGRLDGSYLDSYSKDYGFDSLARTLKTDEAIIEFVYWDAFKSFYEVQKRYGVYITRRNSTAPIFIDLFSRDTIKRELDWLDCETCLTKMVNRIYHERRSRDEAPGNPLTRISDLILSKLEEHLKGIKTFYIVPNDVFGGISFHALPYRSGIVMDYWKVRYLLTPMSLAGSGNSKVDLGSALLVGGIQYGKAKRTDVRSSGSGVKINGDLPTSDIAFSEVPYLPYSLQEIAVAKKYLGPVALRVKSLTGPSATETNFRAELREKPSIIHISTHGISYLASMYKSFSPNDVAINVQSVPMSSKALLGLSMFGFNERKQFKSYHVPFDEQDGFLTAYELEMSDMSSADLVVLSACNSGNAYRFGYVSYLSQQRSLKLAGARFIIMSIWQVQEKEGLEFYKYFYSSLVVNRDVYRAYEYAIQEMRRKKYHPYFWAGWILLR